MAIRSDEKTRAIMVTVHITLTIFGAFVSAISGENGDRATMAEADWVSCFESSEDGNKGA